MPRTFSIDMLPMGISLNHAFKGESVTVRTKEFLSSEDGNNLTDRLDGISSDYNQVIGPKGVLPSQVDNFLAIIHKNKEVTVYCNEIAFLANVRKKHRPFAKGEAIFKSDIVDVNSVRLLDHNDQPITIPANCGFAVIFSVGWRKCLYYDYSVLHEGEPERTDDLESLFAHFYSRLLFQEMYSITEEQWQRLVNWGWFPFIWMQDDDRKKLLSFATQDREPASVFDDLCKKFKEQLQQRIESWRLNQLFMKHMEFIENAQSSFLSENYISSIQVLFPRIEGVMRSLHLIKAPGQHAGQKSLVSQLVDTGHVNSVLLPNRFQDYLLNFYFRSFDEANGDVPLSRHTVAHGSSRSQDYDFVRASLGFMILDQIFYYLHGSTATEDTAESK